MTFEEKRRAAFEEWFREYHSSASEGAVDVLLARGVVDVYEYANTQDMWEAWQAALEWQNKGERG